MLFQKEYNATQESLSDQGDEIARKQSIGIEKKMTMLVDDGVGELEEKPSFGIGRAPKDARPINKLEQSVPNQQAAMQLTSTNMGNEEEGKQMGTENEEGGQDMLEQTEEFYEEIPPEKIPDKNAAFQIYKSENSQAKEIEESIAQTTADLKKRKEEARGFSEEGSKLKSQIEELRNKLNEKKQNKLNLADEMTNVIDDEECKLIDELKDVRDHYKEIVDNFKRAKVDIAEMKNGLDLLKIKYVDSFENWFYRKYHIKIEEHELRLAKAKYGVNFKDEEVKEKVNEPDEQAYLNAKKKIQSIHIAKKMEKKIK